jgi:ribosome recycling factor
MFDINDIEKRMKGALDNFKHNLAGLRTGRASAALVDNLRVEVYGSQMPLNQLASINVPEARMISISVWDKANVSAVEKAIQTSNLGLNPNTEGTVIRLNLPPLTEERRKELTKVANTNAEQGRVAVRNVRRDGNDQLKKDEKDGNISKDQLAGLTDKVQKLTDNYIGQIDKALSEKEKEIMTV